MQEIKNNYLKTYGYTPGDAEILALYTQGALILTDKQENKLIEYFNL